MADTTKSAATISPVQLAGPYPTTAAGAEEYWLLIDGQAALCATVPAGSTRRAALRALIAAAPGAVNPDTPAPPAPTPRPSPSPTR